MRANWRLLAIAAIVAVVTALMLWKSRLWSPPSSNQLLLSGPPEFIVLALIVSLGLYLRQVSLHAVELADKIRNRETWATPSHEKLRDKKIEQLDETSAMIELVSPFMILLSIAVGVRIVCDSIFRFRDQIEAARRFLFSFDVIIAVGLLGTLMGLGYAHFDARRKDKRIRKDLRSELASIPVPRLPSGDESKRTTQGVVTRSRAIITASEVLIEFDYT
jgi:hypothetical protein